MHAPTSHDHHFAPLSSLCPAATLPPRRPPDIDGPPGALRRSLEPSSSSPGGHFARKTCTYRSPVPRLMHRFCSPSFKRPQFPISFPPDVIHVINILILAVASSWPKQSLSRNRQLRQPGPPRPQTALYLSKNALLSISSCPEATRRGKARGTGTPWWGVSRRKVSDDDDVDHTACSRQRPYTHDRWRGTRALDQLPVPEEGCGVRPVAVSVVVKSAPPLSIDRGGGEQRARRGLRRGRRRVGRPAAARSRRGADARNWVRDQFRVYLSITFQPTSTRSHRMSILVITHISCHGKDYECRRKVDIADGTIPVGDIVRFFWPRLAPNFTCKSIRSFDGDLEDFVDVENPEAHFVKAKDKYEFRYAEADGTASHSSILHNSFYCKAESTPNGVAFFVQKSQNPQKQSNGETSAATNGNIVNLISPVKVIVKSEPTSAFDLPSTSTNPERSRDSSSHPSPQGNITLNDNYCFDAKADQIVEKSNSGSPASGSSAQKDEFGDQLNEFFNNQDLLNNYSALFNPNGTTSEPSAPEEVTPSRVVPNDMDMSTLVVPNAIEHLQTQVERGQYALAELRKYANGEVSFFEDQVKRIITLAMGDYLFDNYFDSCNAPVRREFCRRYLAQLPGKLRLEIFSNSKTVGTVDCYIKNKKKRIRKIAMRENGCPPAKRACTMKPVEPPPERPRPPALLNEMNSGKVDPFSSEMIVLYKKTNAYRQTLINALNKTPGVEPVDEVVKEFPLLAKNATLLDQDFYMATSRLQSDTVDFEDEWNTEWAPRIEKYFDTVSPNKHAQLERMYGNVPDRQNFKAFLMVFSLLEYNALSLGQVKTMIVECHSMSIADAVVDVRVHKDIKDPLILANEVGFRVCVGNVTLPLTATFATALKQLVQVHYVFRISHKVLFRPIYQVLETIYGLSTNALRFSQRALSLVENLRSAGCCE